MRNNGRSRLLTTVLGGFIVAGATVPLAGQSRPGSARLQPVELPAEQVIDFMIARVFSLDAPVRVYDPRVRRPFELDQESFARLAAFLEVDLSIPGSFSARMDEVSAGRFCVPGACSPSDDAPSVNLLRVAMGDVLPGGEIWIGIHIVHDRGWAPTKRSDKSAAAAGAPIAHSFALARRGDKWVVQYRGVGAAS